MAISNHFLGHSRLFSMKKWGVPNAPFLRLIFCQISGHKWKFFDGKIYKTCHSNLLFFSLLQTSESAVPHSTSRHSNVSSVADVTESWEFRSALEAPIAKLESLDEIDRQVPKFQFDWMMNVGDVHCVFIAYLAPIL